MGPSHYVLAGLWTLYCQAELRWQFISGAVVQLPSMVLTSWYLLTLDRGGVLPREARGRCQSALL